MLVFVIGRAVFIIANLNELNNTGIGEILLTFWYAIYLDISTACYLMAFPFLLLLIQSLLNFKILNTIKPPKLIGGYCRIRKVHHLLICYH